MRDFLLKHNRHWSGTEIETGVKREITNTLLSALDVNHIVAVSGARRSGKSYLFRQILSHLLNNSVPAANILFINFEDPFFAVLNNKAEILDTLFAEYKILKNPEGRTYLFFDEIQNIQNWQLWVRELYDRDSTVKIFITGSNSEMLSVDLATHLTGRVLAYENFPFSFREFIYGMESFSLPENIDYESLFPVRETIMHLIETRFENGFFPETAYLENKELSEDILSQYFQNVIFKDIIPGFVIRNSKTIEQLAYYCSNTFGSKFSYRRLAEAVSSNENTVKEYLSYFEKAYLFFVVEHFEYSMRKQIKYAKKIYISDSGLRNATTSSFSQDQGKHAENIVFTHLRKMSKNINFWADEKSGKEIDFIVKKKNGYLLINVSYTDELPEREFQSFSLFLKSAKMKNYECIVVSRGKYSTQFHDNITIKTVPLWLFLLTLNKEDF